MRFVSHHLFSHHLFIVLVCCFLSASAAAKEMSKDMNMDDMAMDGTDKNEDDGDMVMNGVLGGYTMSREASGTSWQPDSSPMEGMHFDAGNWAMMAHGTITGVMDVQGGKRGANKAFSSSMGMVMGQRSIGERGTLGLRAMLSLDALMGRNGYPLLFATGETADGHDHLTDRQHPHDMFMEMAGTYSYRLNDKSSAFFYAGFPGEPALGPSAFMHRVSGMDNPEAPLTHHWMDSTHVTFGVVTAGYVYDRIKIEASAFNGREPNQQRFDFEQPKLNSASSRITFNPTDNWSMQASWGFIQSPEQLSPDVNENRISTSATYNLPFDDNNWATMFSWGRKINQPGHVLDGFLLESALTLHDMHTFFARGERVDEDELFDGDPLLEGRIGTVNKFSLGYMRDFQVAEHAKFGVGGLVSRYAYPSWMNNAYGSDPTSFMLFMRLKLI